ncbi:SDR family oxidoreductase [Spongiibacter sp. KMU-166]|uniref:SDR family oxidoreductase n=1 Tax=Spongiibacter thalassae TaxID=2721624 RepID=A0ABX1GBD9_9GAMM|nr:SDR family oxidoreductase [Spongiibacter thalassae]NKI16465.1 SDR family oxidoreductase [Spongiibacter thalassae]
MTVNPFSCAGKKALIIGGASGMGAAVARAFRALGGHTIVMDIAEINFDADQSIKVNLAERESVDAALAEIDGPVDTVFACAGIAGGPPIIYVNFIGQRHIVDTLVANDGIAAGGSVVMISSVAGMGWMENLPELLDFLACDTWESAAEWMEGREDSHNNYMFSKQAVNAYVANHSLRLMKQGVRINAVMPGPTDTPLARANADEWLGFGTDFRRAAGIDALTPEQIAGPMMFLASDAASGINGISILVDGGHLSAVASGAFHDPALSGLL